MHSMCIIHCCTTVDWYAEVCLAFGCMAPAALPFVMISVGQNAAVSLQACMQSMSSLVIMVVMT